MGPGCLRWSGAVVAMAITCPALAGAPARGAARIPPERAFGRPVTVELLESVLGGAKRCRFRIALA